MAVIVKYVVERNGVEKMTFAAKSEADAYDKMLDMADDLFVVLGASQLITDENMQETLALFLAQHKDDVLQALGAKAKTVKKDKVSDDKAVDDNVADDNKEPAAEVESAKTTELNLVAA
jgi:uncharacterized protein